MNNDIRAAIDNGRLSRFQKIAIGICVILNMLDGFDVLVMAFTATSVAEEWNLSGAETGLLLSAGLFGMAAGALFVAPWADQFGRRPLILTCVSTAGLGMLLSAYAQGPLQLGALRIITGLGIGGILASSNVIAAEYANKRWRGLAVSLQSTGYALGATIGGLAAAQILAHLGWRWVFLSGGVATLATLPLILWRLPESIDFLLARQPRNALRRINKLADSIGQQPIEALPAQQQSGKQALHHSIGQLLAPGLMWQTLRLWASFFLVMFGFYFIMSWTPRLLVEFGLSTELGVTGGALLSLGGILGTALVGTLSSRYQLHYLLSAFMVLTSSLLVIFGFTASNLMLALGVATLIGIVANGCIAGMYALGTSIYSPAIRATGLGWAIGIGRIGAICSPILAGLMLDLSVSAALLYASFSSAFLLAAVVVWKCGAPAPRTRYNLSISNAGR
ncbi:MFS transporter [Pseudomaricurvus alkylphenolicus]|uniref:MFS transporter n=1 Tax=Pseudomaricurvus alkylphenolicus TaxID=1306991 RepID=UPI00142276FE|nr:MFS transporter [Pseudomaricurvus alkylphenolicus]NIB43437.1 MFS transporter [Pseudomaricurvus alkylphenolicus]